MKIALSVLVAFILVGCSDEKTTAATQETSVKQEVLKPVNKAIAKVDEVAKQTEVVTKEVAEDVAIVTKDAAKKVVQKSETVVQETKKAVVAVVQTKPTVDGKTVYKTCVTCHGANAQNKALGKSQIIKGWDKTKIISALNGYIDGSYGSTMKGVMKPQASKLSPEEIKAVAEYISTL